MCRTINYTVLDKNLEDLVPVWASLVEELIPEIQDDYRATEDPDDDTPGMLLTIGTNDEASSWSYQTGDNSFTGGAYGFPHWALLYLARDSNPSELARDAQSQIADLIYQ